MGSRPQVGTRVPSARDVGRPTVGTEDCGWISATSGGVPQKRGPALARVACALAAAVVVVAVAWVLWLRADNPGAEPEGENWWLVTWFVVALAYAVTGTALLAAGATHRPVGAAFVVIGAVAGLTAVSIQYAGHEAGLHVDGGWLGDAARWSRVIVGGLIAAVVPWLLRPGAGRAARSIAAATAIVVVIAAAGEGGGLAWVDRGAAWAMAVSATAALAARLTAWWPVRIGTDDPLPAWLAGGAIAAWLAFVPDALSLANDRPHAVVLARRVGLGT